MEANLIKSNGSSKMLTPMLSTPDIIRDIEDFTKRLSTPPPAEGVEKTPDGRAETLTISHVEGKLDEIYLRQWGAKDVNVQVVANEILVWLTLWVIDPSTGIKIERPGFAAVQITVDKVPDSLKNNPQQKNAWSLDLNNKKPNACYMVFPKAKSLAIKNAAQTLGLVFGRNLNRKNEDTPEDYYTQELDANEGIEMVAKQMEARNTLDDLVEIWNQHPDLHQNQLFIKHFKSRKQQIKLQNK